MKIGEMITEIAKTPCPIKKPIPAKIRKMALALGSTFETNSPIPFKIKDSNRLPQLYICKKVKIFFNYIFY